MNCFDGKLADVKARFGKNTIQIQMEGDGAFMRQIPGVEKVSEFNNYIELKLSEGAIPQDILKAVTDKVTVSRFEIMEPSLYNIFIETAGVRPSEVTVSAGGGHA